MADGHGFGKVILFGEHFVVHGLPAIVCALDRTCRADIIEETTNNGPELVDKRQYFPNCPHLTRSQWETPIRAILNYLNITDGIRIALSGNLPIATSGLGTSAAQCVAIARALSNMFSLKLTDEQINRTAYEGEKEIHGNPSGIDNTAATYGGMFWFEKNTSRKHNQKIQKISLSHPVEIVLVDSGKTTRTKEVITEVKTFIEKSPKCAKTIFENYKTLVHKACETIKRSDLRTLGDLMNKNHELLQQLTVSCPELDRLVSLARDAGAIGAKLTGTGRGGLVLALTPGKKLQQAVATSLQLHRYTTLQTTIG